jgi:hypothetical protein
MGKRTNTTTVTTTVTTPRVKVGTTRKLVGGKLVNTTPTPTPTPTPTTKRGTSNGVPNPVQVVWGFVAALWGQPRKQQAAACVNAGVAYYTARTQVQLARAYYTNNPPR